MIYLFDRKVNGELVLGPLTEDDLIVREIMATAWTNFAKFGSPNIFGMTMISVIKKLLTYH